MKNGKAQNGQDLFTAALPTDSSTGELLLVVPDYIKTVSEMRGLHVGQDNGGFMVCNPETNDDSSKFAMNMGSDCTCDVYPPLVWSPSEGDWVAWCDPSILDCECNEEQVETHQCGMQFKFRRLAENPITAHEMSPARAHQDGRRLLANSDENCRIPSCSSDSGYPPNGNSGGHPKCAGCNQASNGGHVQMCKPCCEARGGNGCGQNPQTSQQA